MNEFSIWRSARPSGLTVVRIAVLAVWFLLVAGATWHHVFWRDEVRALSIATQGSNLWQMLTGLHGEGHPVLWYLLLRVGHAVAGNSALPILSVTIATASAILLVTRSPFSWWVCAAILFTRFFIFEYSVMARNYGISMMLMFVLAMGYARWRERGIVIGLLLFLLANTNLPALLLVIALLGYWFLELLFARTPLDAPAWRRWLVNAAIAAAGAGLCVVTVLPTFNDAATAHPGGSIATVVLRGILLPSAGLKSLVLQPLEAIVHYTGKPGEERLPAQIAASLLLFGGTLAFVRRPAALLVAVGSLIAFSLFFTLVSAGGYRHHILWLVLIITLLWMGHPQAGGAPGADESPASRQLGVLRVIGFVLLGVLLAIQVTSGLAIIRRAFGAVPASRSRDLGALISATPALKSATIIGEPEDLVEAPPYYVTNPSYLLREHRPGPIVHYTRHAELQRNLDQMLNDAQKIERSTGQPVILLVQPPLDTTRTATYKSDNVGSFTTTPAQVARFRQATIPLKTFGPVVGGDETFTAYVLKPGPTVQTR